MPRRDNYVSNGSIVSEGVKISVEDALRVFLEDETKIEYAFPSCLTNVERKFIHNFAPRHGLITKSQGNGSARFLTVYKQETENVAKKEATFTLKNTSEQFIHRLLSHNPVTDKERKELQPYLDDVRRDYVRNQTPREQQSLTTGRLSNIVPQVPVPLNYNKISQEILLTRESLPIHPFKEHILTAIERDNVVLISGDTGCGKTTQVPQYILEDCTEKGIPCRIIVAEPRRLAALSVADRVAAERGEELGSIIGYQIRLESSLSPRTLCTFCTNGVLLRTVMGGDNNLQNITHVIIDEVHERDRLSDLLICVMRELIFNGSRIKLILMSATLNTEIFVRYFGRCPVVKVPGRMYHVQTHFLEDILKITDYKASTRDVYFKKEMKQKVLKQTKLLGWCKTDESIPKLTETESSSGYSSPMDSTVMDSGESLSPEVREAVDNLLKTAWLEPNEETFVDLLSLYINESVPVDYRHPETGVTALIVSTCRGKEDFVDQFLNLGATVGIRTDLNDWNALDWAKHFKFDDIASLLSIYLETEAREEHEKEADQAVKEKELTEEEKKLLEAYHRNFDDDAVDLKLIMMILHHIFQDGTQEEPKGGILVFLPGYDEIVNLRQLIMEEFHRFNYQYVLFTLHSQMQTSDHRKVFRPVPQGIRKVVLATNIAETSVTIDDIVYVIDSGKVKEKSFDAILGVTTMQSVRISQANAIQRRGRAGRCKPGVCFHLFSTVRFKSMIPFQVPEIMRMPAHELCLQVKLLAPGKDLNGFLSRLPDPPSGASIKNSIALLKAIDAFDSNESLTELGILLLDLPIEPHLGKVVLHGVVLQCLDPILTIVCSISYRDPFVIPADPKFKHKANESKLRLSNHSFSDHMVLLKAFQEWQKAKNNGYERKFCSDNFISPSTMEMILGLRTQLLGQLRASGFVRAKGPGDIRDLNVHSENWAVVKAALAAGYFPNVIRVDETKKGRQRLISRKESFLLFHPSSVLSMQCERGKSLEDLPSDWLMFEEMARIGRHSFARLCTLISPLTLVLFCGSCRVPPDAYTLVSKDTEQSQSESDDDKEDTGQASAIIKIDDWVTFRLDDQMASLCWDLRLKWQSLFLRRMTMPHKQGLPSDSTVVRTIAEVLNHEENHLGIHQPIGVGQRPIPMTSNFCSPHASTSSAFLQSPNPPRSSGWQMRGGYNPIHQPSYQPINQPHRNGRQDGGGPRSPRTYTNSRLAPGPSRRRN